MKKTVILLGSNIGDRLEFIENAKSKIVSKAGKIILLSSIYESEAWGYEAPENYLNQVIVVETVLNPFFLLKELQLIEQELGRIRDNNQRYTSRTIDLDILFYANEIIRTTELSIPHPEIVNRRFTLIPLVEIIPDYRHPVALKTMSELLNNCKDDGNVREYITS